MNPNNLHILCVYPRECGFLVNLRLIQPVSSEYTNANP